jgi:hypothetical protein
MGVFCEDLDDHEGYAMRRLADGTLTTWSSATRAFTGLVSGCECGWRGSTDYPPTQAGQELAIADWFEHADLELLRRADSRRAQLVQALRALGRVAEFTEDPANLPRISRAVDRARGLVDDVRRDLERQVPKREVDGDR